MSRETKGRTMIGTAVPIPKLRPPSTHVPLPPASTPTSSGPIRSPAEPDLENTRPHSKSAPPASWGGTTITMVPGEPLDPNGPFAPIARSTADDPDMFAGQELCGYVIRRKLAEGGMGVVYEGVHGKIGRLGAIKVLRLELCRAEDVVERFYQEARAVNAIRHENIVDIYDFGRDPHGRVFFVMEYLEGEPLAARIRRGAVTWSEAFPILQQTLRALKAAHDKGFIHRDLKPDNIWLRYVERRVQVKLLDFGIAKLVGSDSPADRLTRTGSVIGTPHYMSPEQINGAKDIDHRADIYALGVIMYEMFAGITPFVGDTLQAIITGHLFRQPPRLVDLPKGLGVPAAIAEIVDRMLVKDPADRYASVSDVLADLRDVNRNRPPAKAETLTRSPPVGAPSQVATPAGKRRRRTLIVGGLAVAAVAGIAIGASLREAADAPAAVATVPGAPSGSLPVGPSVPVERPIDFDAVRRDAQITLRASLREAEPDVRVQGSEALGKIRDQPSTPALAGLTERDPDAAVRGHAAEALGAIGASSTARLLARLETGAPPPLKVWYASALARLGDQAASKRLLGYARSADLAVSFKAGLTLADITKPGDPNARAAIAALRGIAAHEAELVSLAPYAGAVILTKLAALRDPSARKVLYTILAHRDEGARLAAAEGLARLGDDAGKQVLQQVFANEASPNRLVAAVAQIALGDYGGLPLITAALDTKDPAIRRLAARALGDIAERTSLRALLALTGDGDWTVRIAASAAIVAIVGLDPQVLARASLDWTKGALESQDWAVRKAAAGVLADIPESDAVPLLAQAIVDPDRNVRLAASRSAGKMKSADAARQVAAAVKTEADPGVKEQQVRALGQIGDPAARATLATISEEPGRIGVMAAGSLIAVGDASGTAKLEAAVVDRQDDLRLAAVQAASAANIPIVVPTLKIGLVDRIFGVRFTAAEGLAIFHDKAAAMPVLVAALESKDAEVVGRALAAMATLGEVLKDKLRTPGELLDSPDPAARLAAIPVVRALPVSDAVPLLRRLVADPDQEVRRGGGDPLAGRAPADHDKAAAMPVLVAALESKDADPVVRSKAAGQMSRLVPPPPTLAAVTPAAPPGPVVDEALRNTTRAFDDVTGASAEAKAAAEAFEALIGELATVTSTPARDDTTTKHVEELAANVEGATAKVAAAAARLEVAASAVSVAAGPNPSPEATELVDQARAVAQGARDAADAAQTKAGDAANNARKYVKVETGDAQMFIAAADAALAARDITDAKHNLDNAAKLLRKSGATNASLDYLYAQLYDQMATRTQASEAKRKLLHQAEDAYRRFTRIGAGPRVHHASDRLAEIADEINNLDPP